tara:strand:+ start:2404 stop:2619 length:216 start_codon:yes stop_codon:yes gene_type:complete
LVLEVLAQGLLMVMILFFPALRHLVVVLAVDITDHITTEQMGVLAAVRLVTQIAQKVLELQGKAIMAAQQA